MENDNQENNIIEDNVTKKEKTENKKNKFFNKKNKILFGLLLILLIGFGLFLYFSKNERAKDSNKEPETKQDNSIKFSLKEVEAAIEKTGNADSLTIVWSGTGDVIGWSDFYFEPPKTYWIDRKNDLIMAKYMQIGNEEDDYPTYPEQTIVLENLNGEKVYGYYQDIEDDWFKHHITDDKILDDFRLQFKYETIFGLIIENWQLFEDRDDYYYLEKDIERTNGDIVKLQIKMIIEEGYISEAELTYHQETTGDSEVVTYTITISNINETEIVLPKTLVSKSNELDSQERLKIMEKLVDYNFFVFNNEHYNDVTKFTGNNIAWYVDNSEKNIFTDQQLDFIKKNYDTTNWFAQEVKDYYTSLAEVKKYYKEATNLELQFLEGSISSLEPDYIYIKEYEAYVYTGGAIGWCGASNLLFGCGGPSSISYVKNKTNLGGNRVMIEVVDYAFLDDLYEVNEAINILTHREAIDNFIFKNIQSKVFVEEGKTYYLMHQENNNLYFRARSDKPFN